jgi:hypothetical protein
MAHVLSRSELRNLLKVKTTKKQAEQIILRNQLALEMLKNYLDDTVLVGCPHCEACDVKCSKCAYNIGTGGNIYCQEYCLDYSFGGFRYRDVQSIIDIRPTHMHVRESTDEHTRYKARVWMEGHIEWAQAVLNQKRKAVKREPKLRRGSGS